MSTALHIALFLRECVRRTFFRDEQVGGIRDWARGRISVVDLSDERDGEIVGFVLAIVRRDGGAN